MHLAVVDPGVSAAGRHARRAVAIRTVEHDHLLVGPDNGLLMPAAERLAGVAEAVDIGESPERLEPVSRTFHGRDIFAPGRRRAGRRASRSATSATRCPSRSCAASGCPRHIWATALLTVHVLRSDTFGNLILDATNEQLLSLAPCRATR